MTWPGGGEWLMVSSHTTANCEKYKHSSVNGGGSSQIFYPDIWPTDQRLNIMGCF
jgi:hypothetical protein